MLIGYRQGLNRDGGGEGALRRAQRKGDDGGVEATRDRTCEAASLCAVKTWLWMNRKRRGVNMDIHSYAFEGEGVREIEVRRQCGVRGWSSGVMVSWCHGVMVWKEVVVIYFLANLEWQSVE